MNKAVYIIGIVFSIVFFIVAGVYVGEANAARVAHLFEVLDSYDPYASSYASGSYADSATDITREGAWIALFFLLFFLWMNIRGLVNVKTKTSKVMSIIGLSLSFIFFLWNLVMVSSPDSISFDEVGPFFLLYSVVMLAFAIIGLIQSIRFQNRPMPATTAPNPDLLDS